MPSGLTRVPHLDARVEPVEPAHDEGEAFQSPAVGSAGAPLPQPGARALPLGGALGAPGTTPAARMGTRPICARPASRAAPRLAQCRPAVRPRRSALRPQPIAGHVVVAVGDRDELIRPELDQELARARVTAAKFRVPIG